MKLDTPNGFRRIQIKTATGMVSIEFANLAELRDAVDREIAHLVDQLSNTKDEAEQARAIQNSADKIAELIAAIILAMRREARDLARKSLRDELDELDIDFEPDYTPDRIDAAAAAAIGLAFAAVWGQTALRKIFTTEKGEDPEIRKSLMALDYRLKRIATTETAMAFNDEHQRALDQLKGEIDTTHLAERWDAILDRKTCSTCRDHDGEIVPLGQKFSNDDEPGAVHANCRCMSTLVPLPSYYTKVA